MPMSPWVRAGYSFWSLSAEASMVIALRTMKIAAGGAEGAAEAQRMISEKIDAGISLQAKALSGGLGFMPETATNRTIAHYRSKVRANRRRLMKD